MQTTSDDGAVMQKTRELCQAILNDPAVQSMRRRIDVFMGDAQARTQYESLVDKGQVLQDKQQRSMPLTGEEISDFEQHRDALLANPVARDFLDAQQEMREVQQSIQQYVNRTFELGRMPSTEDFSSCGHGCSCGH